MRAVVGVPRDVHTPSRVTLDRAEPVFRVTSAAPVSSRTR
jgi:hypothetical protein